MDEEMVAEAKRASVAYDFGVLTVFVFHGKRRQELAERIQQMNQAELERLRVAVDTLREFFGGISPGVDQMLNR